ncbi:MAG: hypothetical protein GVY30_02880 [Chloroflexi bacterium]|jgi:hypothetical protein|nr:hypothetical protein [Chloroflexota bacterium]
MPQLVKGGKWVFGWAVAGEDGSLPIPPAAWAEYGFRIGDTAIFVRGSAHSGGFSLSTPTRWPATFAAWEGNPRVLGTGTLTASHRAVMPPGVGVKPGDRLLVIRGSAVGLGFAARGRICAAAREHPELEVFRPS